jgi:hypothetical protein
VSTAQLIAALIEETAQRLWYEKLLGEAADEPVPPEFHDRARRLVESAHLRGRNNSNGSREINS